uniref:Non-heme iron oxygenase ferredoxin subunit n=1 Tax=Candidatus Methanomethylicus mesodigestus TaxID=1867258 RepID=A0A7C3F4L5_9CREN
MIMLPSVILGRVDEFPPGTKKSIRASKTRVLLVNVNGTFYATQSLCTHLSNPLFTGKLQGYHIWCDKHWAAFDVRDGKVIELPEGMEKLEPLKTYPVKVEDSKVIVEVPE